MTFCRVLYDYDGTEGDELSIRRDDTLEVLEKHDDDWWLCRSGDKIGLIPSNYVYVTISSPRDRLKDPIARLQSQPLLNNEKADFGDMGRQQLPQYYKNQKATMETKIPKLQMPHRDRATPTNTSNSLSSSAMNSSDLARLKELREDADKKIAALKMAVAAQDGSQDSGVGVGTNPPSKKGGGGSDIVQALSYIVEAKAGQSLSETEGRLMEQLRTLLSHADIAPTKPSSSMPNQSSAAPTKNRSVQQPAMEDKPSHHYDVYKSAPDSHPALREPHLKMYYQQANNNESPVPAGQPSRRMLLPQLKTPAVSSSADNLIGNGGKYLPYGASPDQRSVGGRSRISQSFDIAHHNKRVVDSKHPNSNPASLSPIHHADGVRYPHCRSVIYPPSEEPEMDSILCSSGPHAKLSLKYVHGYDGDIERHGGTIRGKNVMFVSNTKIIFPAAALVVIMNIDTTVQSFFSGHSEDVTCVTLHPDRMICASGQMGKDGRICVWDQSLIEEGKREFNAAIDMFMGGGVRGVCGLNFSADGHFLVALGIDDAHTLVVFELASGMPLVSAKVGHSEVSQMGFNPYLFLGIDRFEDGSFSRLNAHEDQQLAGCYTLVSCGGRQIKFWTFKKILERNDQMSMESGGFKGRQLLVPKNKHLWTAKYVLEGVNAHFPKSGPDLPNITCFVSICDEDEDNNESSSVQKSRIFTGTSSGAVYIWQHVVEQSNFPIVTWQAKGRLLSVVTDVHDAPIYDIDYTGRWSPYINENEENDDLYSSDNDKRWLERIITASKDAVVNVWKVERSGDARALPIEHLCGVNLSTVESTPGCPRSIHWDLDGTTAIVGTTSNSICLLGGGCLVTGLNDINQYESSPKQLSINVELILRAHASKVRRVAVHPFYDYFLTVSADRTARLWDSTLKKQIASYKFDEKVSCASFSPDGTSIAIGNEAGELIILEAGALVIRNKNRDDEPNSNSNSSSQAPHRSDEGNNLAFDQFRVRVKKNVAAKLGKITPGGAAGQYIANAVSEDKYTAAKKQNLNALQPNKNKKPIQKKCEVMEIKYSPSGSVLAVGCRDNLIHLLAADNGYKRYAVCRGHSSHIKNFDFSSDGSTLQSTDVVREILFWNVVTGKQIHNALAVRDVDWNSWSCIYGWPVQGVFNGIHGTSQDGEINAVNRSHDGTLIVAGASNTVNSAVKLFRYPCLEAALPSLYGGHTSPALDVAFLFNDSEVISVGGNDACVFQWTVQTSE